MRKQVQHTMFNLISALYNRECSVSVVESLTRDQGLAGLCLTCVVSLIKIH